MNSLQIFANPEFGQVRTATIDGEPFFVGKDVAEILGYSNTRKALTDHVDDEDKLDGVTIRDSIGREQSPVFINESGLYSLILRSHLHKARQFKRWVTAEVLPAIRKTGKYSLTQGKNLTVDDYMKAAQLVATCKAERLPYVLGFLQQAGFAISGTETPEELEHNEPQKDLVQLLNECGLTITELSRKLGIHKVCLSRYKRGIYTPRPERYRIIVEALSRKEN